MTTHTRPADLAARRQSSVDIAGTAGDPLCSADGCRHCHGTGQDPDGEGFPCLPCDGTGWRQ